MSNHELSIILPELEIPSPTAAKPAIPEKPERRETPEIPDPTRPRIPQDEPGRFPAPKEPIKIPTPAPLRR